MDSISNFVESLQEIDLLVKYAQRNSKDFVRYRLFNKVAVVLLMSKFENFLEMFIEEHSDKQLQGHSSSTFPDNLKVLYLDEAAKLIIEKTMKEKKEKYAGYILQLYGDSTENIYSLKSIKPSCSFNYGKHGSEEIKKLFSNHGLSTFIRSDVMRPILDKLNSCIAIRNNIIHQDTTPSLTHQDVVSHAENIRNFVTYLKKDIDDNKVIYYRE